MTTKSLETVVTERGQVSIPAEIRRELNLTPGKRLSWRKVADDELCVTIASDEKPVGAMAMLGFARTFRGTSRTTEEWMRELREGEEEWGG
ncbi:MAG: AbrB/MazE/SpoVT family DNA-binding domain-containing protein [Acidobacteriota bacterium]